METALSKRRESLLRALTTRHGRKNSGYCLVEGLRCVNELIALRPDLIDFCLLREGCSADRLPVEKTTVLDARKFDSLAATVNSQGILAIAKQPGYVPLDAPRKDPYALVLDRIADPGNFGTIIRTARAVGLKEIWTVKGGVDPFGDKALRSASSAQFAVSIRLAESLEEMTGALKKLGVTRFFRTEPAEGHSVFREENLFQDSAIVLGNEANGAGPVPGALPLNIPMPGPRRPQNRSEISGIRHPVQKQDKRIVQRDIQRPVFRLFCQKQNPLRVDRCRERIKFSAIQHHGPVFREFQRNGSTLAAETA